MPTEYELMKWQDEKIYNGHCLLKITGHDNGDGDGPHWFNLEIDTRHVQCAGDFGSRTNITINSLESLRNLAESFSRAYHKALSIKEQNELQKKT